MRLTRANAKGREIVIIVAGDLREPFPVFLAMIAVAKTEQYITVVAVAFAWM